MGWSGVVYEPLAEHWRNFAAARPRDTVFPVAVSDQHGTRRFWKQLDLSTLEPDWFERRPDEYEESRVRTIDAAGLAGQYDFCSLDVEGHEAHVVARLDFERLRIGVFMVESQEFGTERLTYETWEPILLEQGYEFVGEPTALNRFYRHRDYPAAEPPDFLRDG